MRQNILLWLCSIFFLFNSTLVFSYNSTERYYRCENRVSGSWTFGKAPYACDAKSFGDDFFVYQNYYEFIFDGKKPEGNERLEYMTRMHTALSKVGEWYLLKREPSTSAAELLAWKHALFAKVHQESFWSHYRIAPEDSRLKMMRGDYGHGHGLGQIDDRWHFVKINEGVAWDLFENFVYGMDIFYNEWKRAENVSCVSKSNPVTRARAAYAAYNGGPSQLCRWTNPNAKWARNDVNFYNKFKARTWEKYIVEDEVELEMDVICLAQQNNNCKSGGVGAGFSDGDLLKIPDGSVCLYNDDEIKCLESTDDLVCLNAITNNVKDSFVNVKNEDVSDFKRVNLNRHQLCEQFQPLMHAVGDTIKLKKSINLRSTPGGGKLAVAEVGTETNIIDFHLQSATSKHIYYKIDYKGTVGYVYAGGATSANDWTELIESNDTTIEDEFLADTGNLIEIRTASGINLRKTPGGAWMDTVPTRYRLKVYNRVIEGDFNKVYYLVEYKGKFGYIYAGSMRPINYLGDWTKKIK